MKAFVAVFIFVFLTLVSCNRHEPELKGVITNSQIFYDLIGTHNYPRILFFSRIENSTKDSVSIILENRIQVASHLDQFLWFLENDTLKLIATSFYDLSEEKIIIPPDSSLRLVLRTGALAFWDEDKMELSDSTYYKNLLRKYSFEGDIYFVDDTGSRILMERKESFQIFEGYHRLPSAH